MATLTWERARDRYLAICAADDAATRALWALGRGSMANSPEYLRAKRLQRLVGIASARVKRLWKRKMELV